MLMENKNGSSKEDRKLVQKNRRYQMKSLCSELVNLIPNHQAKESASLADQIDEATNYIMQLESEMEKLKRRKQKLMGLVGSTSREVDGGSQTTDVIKRPEIEIHCVGSALEVILIGGVDSRCMFYKIIRVLHEVNAEVVKASFSLIDNTIIHSIHAVVEDSVVTEGVARITMRLYQLLEVSVNQA